MVGTSASFSVIASGGAPLTYKWYRDGNLVAGAISATYLTPVTVAGDDGCTFTVEVRNAVGGVMSGPAKLTVQVPASIQTQPASQTVTLGIGAQFSVNASGSAPITYQWHRDGQPITGATDSHYSLPSTGVADNGAAFAVTVHNAFGEVTSSPAALVVVPPPVISAFTSGKSVVASGSSTSLSAMFSDGVGMIDQGVGAVMSGSASSTGPLVNASNYPTSRLFSLTVTNAAGLSVNRQISVDIVPVGLSAVAGVPSGLGTTDGLGAMARFNRPQGVAVDGAGNCYIADTLSNTIRKVLPTGEVTTLAGKAGSYGSADGLAGEARFSGPIGLATDGSGNLFVADSGNCTIRKVTPDGMVTTFAGTPGMGGSVDGIGALARFLSPYGLAIDASGVLFVSDLQNGNLRKITAEGVVTTLAGNAGIQGHADGVGSAATFNWPAGLALDGAGNLYVADAANRVIRKVSMGGVVTTMAGTAGGNGWDGVGPAAGFLGPWALASDSAGTIWVADSYFIRRITSDGSVTTLSGSGGLGGTDGPLTQASFRFVQGMTRDGSGNLYLADTPNNAIRKIAPDGMVSTLVGVVSTYGTANGTGATAQFSSPMGIATDASGNIYVADSQNAAIRRITPGGVTTTFSGQLGTYGHTDGTTLQAQFEFPMCLVVDGDGTTFVGDARTIRKISPDGQVSTLAGTVGVSGNTDGQGSAATFAGAWSLALAPSGVLVAADWGNQTIRLITKDGVVSTLAGRPGWSGSVDGQGATAMFKGPSGVAVDASGTVYVTDKYNHTIRKVLPDGTVSTLAGLAGAAGSSDGTGASARFNEPQELALDSAGNLLVTDMGNSTIRKVTMSGVVTTVLGVAGSARTDLGPTPTLISFPRSLALDSVTGHVLVVVPDAVLRFVP